jgi:hypothetical protein
MINRAAILIGVKKVSGLAPLRAVRQGIAQVREWIEAQPGFHDIDGHARLAVLDDSAGPVTASAVYRAVNGFVKDGTIEQLVVYFAGHGVAVATDEVWLLSEAMENPNEAVALSKSTDHARYCGIPHVVFISDACRTLATTMASQSAAGSNIFPSPNLTHPQGTVDAYYATSLGDAALEADAGAATGNQFEALYTSLLTKALCGQVPSILEPGDTAANVYVRPWPLADYIADAVPRRLAALGITDRVQTPRSIVSSRPTSWVSDLEKPGVTGGGTDKALPDEVREDGIVLPYAQQLHKDAHRTGNLFRFWWVLLTARLRPYREQWPPVVFSLRGSGIAAVHLEGEPYARHMGNRVEIDPDRHRNRNLLVEFGDGRGMLLPVLPGFAVKLHYDAAGQRLKSLSYTPYVRDQSYLDAFNVVRVSAGQRSRAGRFQIRSVEEARHYTETITLADAVDPLYASYVAFALHDHGFIDLIRDIDAHIGAVDEMPIVDVHLLSRRPGSRGGIPPNLNAVPLLSRSWQLLDTKGMGDAGYVGGIDMRPYLTNSFWTVFKREGVDMIKSALEQQRRR